MKLLNGSILLVLILTVTGCNQRGGGGGTNDGASSTLTEEEVEQQHAQNYLAEARDHQKAGRTDKAISVLNELIEEYPASDEADEAARMLVGLGKAPGESE